MNYYINLKVLPDPEFEVPVLLNALYAKCHRVIGQLGEGQVGVSFPNYKKTLGDNLRLHGSKEKLSQLMAVNWLKGLGDYTQVSEILAVPNGAQYRTVGRKQKKSPQNKRKRAIAKGWCTATEAEEKFKDDLHEPLTLPYAQIKSLSTQNSIRVFIEHGELQENPVKGTYSSYGLSQTATIPWFS